ncbi:MAG: quinone-dependent dihydroorotate dehydrogenase [Bacteroidia bacterium]|nr:quinone-dependent dihydroorotate dehydrogenase [Bacteroidia bacterium]
MYKFFLRPILFLLPAETAHSVTMGLLKFFFSIPMMRGLLKWLFSVDDKRLHKSVAGLNFKNPVGLAAGFDKNAKYVDELACLGFGYIEIGTVTPLPQPGNPKPRLFRLKKDSALINRMGFNNDGAKAIAERLRRKKSDIIVGVNIGKNKTTSNENAAEDYEKCFREFYVVADYFVVNVSSPNTPGLRELQEKEPLKNILTRLMMLNHELQNSDSKSLNLNSKPILLKISPDLTLEQLDDIIKVVIETKIAGVIASNTTVSRERLQTPDSRLQAIGNGGLSGKPLANSSTEIIRYLSLKAQGNFSIIGCGGIFSEKDALEKIIGGAILIQIYTGFIYEGPSLVKNICRKLIQ